MRKLVNAFSVNMLGGSDGVKTVDFTPISVDDARLYAKLGVESIVGHPDTAAVIGNLLGIEVPVNRASINIGPEGLLLAQYSGPRLPEGATTLPEGAKIEFWLVDLVQ